MTLKTISIRSRLHLQACSDWKADWEIVKLMGDTPPMKPRHARPHLGRLIGEGAADVAPRQQHLPGDREGQSVHWR